MTLLAVLLAVLLAIYLYKRSRKGTVEVARDTTPELDGWLRAALEDELGEHVTGIRGATPEERKELARTLANEPVVEVVSRIEEMVKAVELEFVKYAHEADVEATVRVRYEDGKVGSRLRRMPLADVPASVREDFEKKGSTRVFRTWAFPWQRVHAL